MKLPLIKSANVNQTKLITNKYKIIDENKKQKDSKEESLASKLKEIQEIKIYLSQNFNAYDVDENPHAYYIQQAGNGLFAREAIFCDVLGISLEEVRNDKTIIS